MNPLYHNIILPDERTPTDNDNALAQGIHMIPNPLLKRHAVPPEKPSLRHANHRPLTPQTQVLQYGQGRLAELAHGGSLNIFNKHATFQMSSLTKAHPHDCRPVLCILE